MPGKFAVMPITFRIITLYGYADCSIQFLTKLDGIEFKGAEFNIIQNYPTEAERYILEDFILIRTAPDTYKLFSISSQWHWYQVTNFKTNSQTHFTIDIPTIYKEKYLKALPEHDLEIKPTYGTLTGNFNLQNVITSDNINKMFA